MPVGGCEEVELVMTKEKKEEGEEKAGSTKDVSL